MEGKRKYSSSSSFKMAVLFAILLTISASILVYFIYSYGQGRYINENEVAIDSGTYELILVLGIFSIISMSLVVGISFLISTFVVKRINIIGVTAENIIKTGNLSRRISIDTRWDDLSNLAGILNDLLARIESSMEDVRRVSDNIAHDLRTPLTRLKNNLEDAKKNKKFKEENIDKLISEADSLLGTFNALLRITNIEKGKRHSEFQELNLKQILIDVVELYEPLIEEKKISLEKNIENVNFKGDRDLLFQAFANILDNAIKFTPQNGKIKITLKNNEDIKIIEISDTGEGVSKEDKGKIFDRFYRGDKSRSSSGSGLGLSLVHAIVKLHKGVIELSDNKPSGLKVIVKL